MSNPHFLRSSAVTLPCSSHFRRPRSDACWSVGSTACIKSFLGATWSFSLFDEAVSKEFVDSVRLGILACLSRNFGGKEESSSTIALFQAEAPSDMQLPRVDSAGRDDADEFPTISLGQDAVGDLPTRSPESTFARFFS
jgi:hypothetical protein